MTALNWLEVTQKLVDDFKFQQCFLLNRNRLEWVGDQPPAAFRDYLTKLFETKPSSYFDEVRFYKFQDGRGKKTATSSYLALIPVALKQVDYQFLGVVYENPDTLQELLKFRIMPMYLIFWLHKFVTEARILKSSSGGERALAQALEEKRLYAGQLENKLQNLNRELDEIRESGLSQDQKLKKIGDLLEARNAEYKELAGAYQDLFQEHQDFQTEHLETCVGFEQKIHLLELEIIGLESELESPAKADEVSNTTSLAKELAEARLLSDYYQEQCDTIVESYGGLDPKEITALIARADSLQKKVDHYRKRCLQQQHQLTHYQKRLGDKPG